MYVERLAWGPCWLKSGSADACWGRREPADHTYLSSTPAFIDLMFGSSNTTTMDVFTIMKYTGSLQLGFSAPRESG